MKHRVLHRHVRRVLLMRQLPVPRRAESQRPTRVQYLRPLVRPAAKAVRFRHLRVRGAFLLRPLVLAAAPWPQPVVAVPAVQVVVVLVVLAPVVLVVLVLVDSAEVLVVLAVQAAAVPEREPVVLVDLVLVDSPARPAVVLVVLAAQAAVALAAVPDVAVPVAVAQVAVVEVPVAVEVPVSVRGRRSGVVRSRSSAPKKPHTSHPAMHPCPRATLSCLAASRSKNLHQN